MQLIYITGIETAGKTTVSKALKKRGYEAHDIDDGIAHYYNKVTGDKARGTASGTKRTQAWYEQHFYMMDRSKVEDYKKKARKKLIFLCGTTRNDYRVIDLFGSGAG